MDVMIDSSICRTIPQFKVGLIHYTNIQVAQSPQMLRGRFRLFQESLFLELEDKHIADLPNVKEWRDIFKKTGKDPNRYRHSAEALLRRMKKQSFLSSVNSAIDVNNFFSLKWQMPLGIYDCDKINGNTIQLRIGEENEEYEGINGRSISLQHLIIACDERGGFGSPFVDSVRTAVGTETTEAVQIVYLTSSFPNDEIDALLHSLKTMFIQMNGGEGTISIKTCP
ncbi:B3/B4 domain-containing protein [Bacillus chungangensis]|uniref:DNA/RNA-binding domain of Phe-tRNA-synthetase-like protein n=1 Tax=Bacillus chungangensis TaxID=587633 RepID=A0ABT9WT72_9BACI|nr:phenylalanine--tRNA ligase beta subunit-related protein [Bacillus chungangensis]MDQ0176482.1 DNA/RNA-binding domain of Phe-tRNA-synthetase-like protein [Bacillus chungangensis]